MIANALLGLALLAPGVVDDEATEHEYTVAMVEADWADATLANETCVSYLSWIDWFDHMVESQPEELTSEGSVMLTEAIDYWFAADTGSPSTHMTTAAIEAGIEHLHAC